ncbi:MAG: hypothetical protein WCV90_09200 [Candidatus Woesearchaeota archaeon]
MGPVDEPKEKKSVSAPDSDKFADEPKATSVSAPDPDKFVDPSMLQKAVDSVKANPGKYGMGAAAALGAGLGAVALAKKLRAKKAAAKKK